MISRTKQQSLGCVLYEHHPSLEAGQHLTDDTTSRTHNTGYEEHLPSLLNLHIVRPRLVLRRICKERLRFLLCEEDRLLPNREVQRWVVHKRDLVERLRALPRITIGPAHRHRARAS